MKRIITGRVASFAVWVILLSLSSHAFADKFFRWIDDNGKVYYSYTLPPDTSQKSYTELNKTGRQIESVSAVVKEKETTEQVIPEKTKEEKAAEEAKKKYDNYLLSTYLSIDELTAAFLEKQTMLKDQVDLYNERITKLEASLVTVGEQERNEKNKVSKDNFKNYLSVTTDSINVYKEMISNNQKKLKKLNEVYEMDKIRLAELLSALESKDKKAE